MTIGNHELYKDATVNSLVTSGFVGAPPIRLLFQSLKIACVGSAMCAFYSFILDCPTLTVLGPQTTGTGRTSPRTSFPPAERRPERSARDTRCARRLHSDTVQQSVR